jgi:hypothetical protein
MARSIQSPGVEIIEKDLSLSPVLPAGTNIFMTGFSQKGPSEEILQITSVEEFEQVYGVPTNPAERYFYYGARQILTSSSGNLFVSRLPYGDGGGEGYGSTYGALVYPVVAVTENTDSTQDVYRNVTTIPASSFQLQQVLDQIVACTEPITFNAEALSSRIVELSTYGLQPYDKFSASEYTYLETGITNYYNDSVAYAIANYTGTQLTDAISAAQITLDLFTNSFSYQHDTTVTRVLTSENSTYVLGAPKFFDLSIAEYQGVIDGSAFRNTGNKWSAVSDSVTGINSPADFGKAGLIIVNKIQSTINNRWEGHYVGIADNTNLLTNSNHDSIRAIYTNSQAATGSGLSIDANAGSKSLIQIPTTKLAFPLSATTDSGGDRNSSSISEALEKVSDIFSDITTSKFDDTLSYGLFRLRTSPYNPDTVKLSFAFEDSKVGSFDYYRQVNNQNGGVPNSFFLENVANTSNNVTMFTNSNINAKNSGSWLDQNGVPKRKVRVFTPTITNKLIKSAENNWNRFGYHINDTPKIQEILDYSDALFPAGSYSNFSVTGKNVGSIPLKLDRALRKMENDEIFDLDLVVEGGLGTIYATVCANKSSYFDDTETSDGLNTGLASLINNDYVAPNDETSNVRDNYNTIFTAFNRFCEKQRKDCMFIADPLRQIFVKGANSVVMNDHSRAFSQYITNPLTHLFENANSSFATTYANWVKINDIYAGMNIWVPFSPFAAANMANVDLNFEPWYAPAGFTRGRVTDVLAVAITPKQRERDALYKKSINPVAYFPNDGINIFGQKTLLRQPSAFDRINVRRLFLYLEKATKKTTKYFVFEPNTLFTRNRVVSVLTPIFDRAKNTQGLYDYQIVCDKRNNPPSTIDQNELVVDIYIKPVRSAEFILVNFYATSTGTNFNEIIAQ